MYGCVSGCNDIPADEAKSVDDGIYTNDGLSCSSMQGFHLGSSCSGINSNQHMISNGYITI